MNTSRRILVVFATLLIVSGSTYANTLLTANLTTNQEPGNIVLTTSTGAPRPTSFGIATFNLNDAMTAMTFSATVFNIDFTGTQTADTNDNLVNAHIHAAPTAGAATFPVVWGFIGSPFNDNNPNDMVLTPFATGVGGTVSGKWDAPEGNGTTLTAQIPNILAGRSYINFHTVQFTGGEIRGAIVAAPDNGTTAVLLGGALLPLAWLHRRLKGRRRIFFSC